MFPLTTGISIEVFGVNLNVANKIVHIQIMLFFFCVFFSYISFDFLSQFLQRRSEFTIASLFLLLHEF